MAFSAPDNYTDIYKITVDRILKLIDFKYIDNIEKGVLRDWLKNFNTPEEQYFATLLLSKLIYRSEKAILSMFDNVFELILPELLAQLGIHEISSINNWKKELNTPELIKELPFCISTITGVDTNIGKSGEDLNRLLKEKHVIFKSINFNLLSNSPIPKRLNTIILIDDIVGTGTQFKKFLTAHKAKLDKFTHIIYVPLVAYFEGFEYIKKLDKKIHIHPLEILDKDKVFLSDSKEKFDGINTHNDLNEFYKNFLIEKKIILANAKYSVDTLYIFKISSPNTNVPLIYHSDANWNKLFKRF